MFATLGCLFLTAVHVSSKISFWWCVLSFLCWHLDDWSGFILWMNSRSFGALRQRCRSLSGERRRKTVSLRRLFYKQISDIVWCQYKLAIYWYKERGILTAAAFTLLAPIRVNLNHSYSNNYNWIFQSSIICFCLVSVSFDVFNEAPCGWWVCLDASFMLSLQRQSNNM